MKRVLIFTLTTGLAGFLAGSCSALAGDAKLYLEPHAYGGARGTEPRFQSWQGVHYETGAANTDDATSRLKLRWEAEAIGRKDSSLDIDRAWIRLTPNITLGRIHPWELVGNPEASRPWGMAAQSQPQNRGIALGTLDRSQPFPEPVLMGWIGAHLHSHARAQETDRTRWAVSFSPLFVPSMGSEVTLSTEESVSTSRFGRRPPATLRVNNALLPLRYRIDTSRLLEDILLQPQMAVQLSTPLLSQAWQNHIGVTRAPQPDARPQADGFVQVGLEDVYAVAVVTPSFPQRWRGFWRGDLAVSPSWTLFHSVAWTSSSPGEIEVGARSGAWEASWLGRLAQSTGDDPIYAENLGQISGSIALSESLTWLGGIKYHFQQQGTWLRTQLLWKARRNFAVHVGGEAFGGGVNAYFGEWRTNDRVWIGVQWGMGT